MCLAYTDEDEKDYPEPFFGSKNTDFVCEMGLSAKLSEMSDDEKLELLATNGMLVKRPLLVGDDFVIPGFREPEWKETLEI